MRNGSRSVASFNFMSNFFLPDGWMHAIDRSLLEHIEQCGGMCQKKKKNPKLNLRSSLRSESFSRNANIQNLFSKAFFPLYHKDNWLASHGSLQANLLLGHEIPGYRAQRPLGGVLRNVCCLPDLLISYTVSCQEESGHAPGGEL